VEVVATRVELLEEVEWSVTVLVRVEVVEIVVVLSES
jgi:hypothetical protein